MRVLLHTEHMSAAASLQEFSRALPEAEFRHWQAGDTSPADVAVVWRPPRELFAGRHDMRAVFNLGAGLDFILGLERAHPGTLPKQALLVRIEDAGMAQQMAEYVLFAVMRYLRRFDDYARAQAERRWQVLEPHSRGTFTIGVLGLGVLGAHVARVLASLGLPVRGFSRHPKRIEGIDCYAGEKEFGAFLDGAMVLVNLLPSTPETDGLLNARTFARLARGAYLINIARGAHLVESELLDALAEGQVAAATLDVFQQEPLPADHPFWGHPDITITPHCSAETLRDEGLRQIVRKIRALSRGEAISGVVDVARGY